MNNIPAEILKICIFNKLDTVSSYIARLVCKNWLQIIGPVQCSLNKFLGGAALGGHKELCSLAKEWGATD